MRLAISKNLKIFYSFLSFYLGKIIIAAIALMILLAALFVVLDIKIYEKSPKEYLILTLEKFEFNQANYQKINVSGVTRTSENEVMKLVDEIIKKSASSTTKISDNSLINKIKLEVKHNFPWVKTITVIRNLSGKSLDIKISEYVPIALFRKGNQYIVIDKNGYNIINSDKSEFKDLIIISGNNADKNIEALFAVLEVDTLLKNKVYSANWIGNRRWDIVLKDGLVIKLPDNNLDSAWKRFIKIYSMQGSNLGTKIIDLRVDSKIYLELAD